MIISGDILINVTEWNCVNLPNNYVYTDRNGKESKKNKKNITHSSKGYSFVKIKVRPIAKGIIIMISLSTASIIGLAGDLRSEQQTPSSRMISTCWLSWVPTVFFPSTLWWCLPRSAFNCVLNCGLADVKLCDVVKLCHLSTFNSNVDSCLSYKMSNDMKIISFVFHVSI